MVQLEHIDLNPRASSISVYLGRHHRGNHYAKEEGSRLALRLGPNLSLWESAAIARLVLCICDEHRGVGQIDGLSMSMHDLSCYALAT